MPALMNAGEAAAPDQIMEDMLAQVTASREVLADNVKEHQSTLSLITQAYKSYRSKLADVKAAALQEVLAEVSPAIEAWNYFHDGLAEGCAINESYRAKLLAPLVKDVHGFCKERAAQRATRANGLLLDRLHAAVSKGDVKAAQALLSPDADTKINVDEHNRGGENAMHIAVKAGDKAMIKALSACGANMNGRTSNGHSYVRVAIQEKKLDSLTTLIECGTDVNQPEDDKTGMNVMHMMARNNVTGVVEQLLKLGASLHTRSFDGRQALHHAAEMDALRTMQVLVKNGAPVNVPDKAGNTAMHLVKDLETKVFLADHGARYKRKNKAGVIAAKAHEEKAVKTALADYYKKPVLSQLDKHAQEGSAQWQNDDEYSNCPLCAAEFGMFTRRHHCRRCGGIACGDCSYMKSHPKKMRVCDPCYNVVRHSK